MNKRILRIIAGLVIYLQVVMPVFWAGEGWATVADPILWEPGNIMLWETTSAVSWEGTASPRNNIELYMLLLSQIDGSLGGSYWAQIETREVTS